MEEAEEESDNEFDDNPESTPQQSTSQPRSTSQPLSKKQKVGSKKSKKKFLLDQAASVFQARKRVEDGDDVFGKNIAFSLREIKNKRIKEYTKLKMQEVICYAQRQQEELPRLRESTIPPVQNRDMQYDAPARQESPIPPSQNGNLQYNAHSATTVFPQSPSFAYIPPPNQFNQNQEYNLNLNYAS